MLEEKYKSISIRLLPTKEQEELMWKHVHASRFIYNWGLYTWEDMYKKNEKPSSNKIAKKLKNLKSGKKWLYTISNKTLVKTLQDLEKNYKMYFSGISKLPRYKSKKTSAYTFPIRTDKPNGLNTTPMPYINLKNKTISIEKLGKITLSNSYTRFNIDFSNIYFYSSRVVYDGKYWYVKLNYKVKPRKTRELTNETIGIDLGIKTLATCSNGKSYKNINKSSKVKKLEKRLKRLQRQVSRKYEMNKQGKKFIKTNNIIKLEKEIKLLHRKLKNIRNNHIHTMTKEIVEQYPSEIVIEDLKVSNLRKNKHLSKHINEVKWYEIRRQLIYKCEDRGILLTIANQYYPSSQTCSCCGKQLTKQDKLSLSQRTFTCECGTKIDRDINASYNLKNYRYSNWYQNHLAKQTKSSK
ncbi:mobile element protein [Staphylococcus phage vB_SauH_SPJ2]|nr:mobile element protein [Staphylococcus phage LSA2308]USZ62932.1 transposase [Staphylococcus phage LSA2311]WEW53676.1 mobile element protein [Staphylococcus phage vB_SauH_SPJ2]